MKNKEIKLQQPEQKGGQQDFRISILKERQEALEEKVVRKSSHSASKSYS